MFSDLFTQHVATAHARQLALADLIGERDWDLDLTAGQVAFGDDLRFPIQLLGTESHLDGTWLWAWANTQSGLPPQLLALSNWMREFGTRQGVAELTDATFPLERADGHRLALVASGLTGRCYYRGPYEGGAVFFHLEGVPDQPVAPERAFTVVNQVLMAYPVDHRAMVTAFLTQQGWRVSSENGLVTGAHSSGSEMRVEFDQLGRISNLTGQLRR
ncbi:hypothetical protein GCM10010168_47370 [Actinoplanes ianthinogenes]|uniref:Uncharacterized protein n=1 Tax=Actinoplanes ianthinogenes TaxID=122358 RepID=A0ABN6C671_9ACTN|nr:DUF6882 domain-containing protein [Actinoplanes ianthinogenes]BCJ40964.1 hypothetical protein Aiant_16210 [Actinoplanes ianthinogenes]GGR23886.1 hypothetical protein GCM10010168_47370 [Actinoplanes ianthinogenes]